MPGEEDEFARERNDRGADARRHEELAKVWTETEALYQQVEHLRDRVREAAKTTEREDYTQYAGDERAEAVPRRRRARHKRDEPATAADGSTEEERIALVLEHAQLAISLTPDGPLRPQVIAETLGQIEWVLLAEAKKQGIRDPVVIVQQMATGSLILGLIVVGGLIAAKLGVGAAAATAAGTIGKGALLAAPLIPDAVQGIEKAAHAGADVFATAKGGQALLKYFSKDRKTKKRAKAAGEHRDLPEGDRASPSPGAPVAPSEGEGFEIIIEPKGRWKKVVIADRDGVIGVKFITGE